MSNSDHNDQALRATIFATAFPAPGKERQWEQAIGDLIRTSMSFPGHQGLIVLKPESAAQPHYRVIARFDTTENMRRWYESEERREKVSHLEPFEQQPAEIQRLTGLETWFTPTGAAASNLESFDWCVLPGQGAYWNPVFLVSGGKLTDRRPLHRRDDRSWD